MCVVFRYYDYVRTRSRHVIVRREVGGQIIGTWYLVAFSFVVACLECKYVA